MRKLVFAALAGVFMLSSGFISFTLNETNEEDFSCDLKAVIYDCNYTLVAVRVDKFGNEYEESKSFSVETIGPRDCDGVSRYHRAAILAGVVKW